MAYDLWQLCMRSNNSKLASYVGKVLSQIVCICPVYAVGGAFDIIHTHRRLEAQKFGILETQTPRSSQSFTFLKLGEVQYRMSYISHVRNEMSRLLIPFFCMG